MKLPSAEAESEIPGVEKPLSRDGLAGAGGGMGATSAAGRTAGSLAGDDALTKIRVNSPGPGAEPDAELGPGDAVGGSGLAAGAGDWVTGDGAAVARACCAWNNCVNSPGPEETELGALSLAAAGAAKGLAAAGFAGS